MTQRLLDTEVVKHRGCCDTEGVRQKVCCDTEGVRQKVCCDTDVVVIQRLLVRDTEGVVRETYGVVRDTGNAGHRRSRGGGRGWWQRYFNPAGSVQSVRNKP